MGVCIRARRTRLSCAALCLYASMAVTGLAAWEAGDAGRRPDALDPAAAAAEVDRLLAAHAAARGTEWPPGEVDDGTLLRRAMLKLSGRTPTADEVTYFALDPDPAKTSRSVDRLLAGDAVSGHWARYWRDVLYAGVQDRRALAQRGVFEAWLRERFEEDLGWNEIVRRLITATGDVAEDGATALIVAQQAEATRVAAETSRLFLGIQIQCAECHDHPYDDWTREQFHQLAAFFPRVRLERQRDAEKRNSFSVVSLDRGTARARPAGALVADPQALRARFDEFDENDDRKLVRRELPRRARSQWTRLVRIADKDGDGALTQSELAAVPMRRRRPRGEHFMPDLENPQDGGTYMRPQFFVSGATPAEGLGDLDRRRALAGYITAPENPWFAKAFVNRVWSEMVGSAFVTPVDDLGAGRDVVTPEVFELLSAGFRKSGYRLKWLLGTIARTSVFRGPLIREAPRASSSPGCSMTRLRGDQLFDSLAQVLRLDAERGASRAGATESGRSRRGGGLRALVRDLFGADPSAPPEDIAGTIDQALFMMNSRLLEAALAARPGSVLGELLTAGDDRTVLGDLYLRTLSRRPTAKETAICIDYVARAGDRREAFEDIFWSLLNSAEFVHHR